MRQMKNNVNKNLIESVKSKVGADDPTLYSKCKNNVEADDSVRPLLKRNTQRGITLVALVITIIVLLILAVVTITIITNSGLITKTSDATTQHTIASEKEAIQTGYAQYQIELSQKGTAELKVKGTKVDSNKEGWNVIFEKTNNSYQINQNGEIIVLWKDNENGTFTKGDVTVKIGDYVNYDATKDKNGNEITGEKATYTSYSANNASASKNEGRSSGWYKSNQVFNLNSYTSGWRILGIENGDLRIISEDIIEPDSGGYESETDKYYYLYGQKGYTDGPLELNAISSMYGQGKGVKTAKSITVEDINKITGYNPITTGNGKPYGVGSIYEYGNKVTYYWDGTDKPYWEGINKKQGKLTNTHKAFWWHDGDSWKKIINPMSDISANKEKITEITNTFYRYYPTTLTERNNGVIKGIKQDSAEWKLLFKNTQSGKKYWLASSYMKSDTNYIGNGVYYISNMQVTGYGLFYSGGFADVPVYNGIRPVLTLKSDIQLSGNSTDGWTIE